MKANVQGPKRCGGSDVTDCYVLRKALKSPFGGEKLRPAAQTAMAAYFCRSVSLMGTVPPSLAWSVRFAVWYPSSLRVIVWIPEGICTRAGVNCKVELPSTMISAPLGLLSTCAQATRVADLSVRGTLSCVWMSIT